MISKFMCREHINVKHEKNIWYSCPFCEYYTYRKRFARQHIWKKKCAQSARAENHLLESKKAFGEPILVASSTTNESRPITTSTNSKESTNHSDTSEKTIAELYKNNSIPSNIDLSQYVETKSKLVAGRLNFVDILSSAEVLGLNEELVSLCTKAQKKCIL